MIGNDVVDLGDAETQHGAVNARFDARVFAPSERALLAADAAPSRLRWRLWAAKEAAYKAARRLDGRVVFSPPLFVVNFDDETVRHGTDDFAVMWEDTDTYVHVVATMNPRAGNRPGMRHIVRAVAPSWSVPRCEPSQRVRALAQASLADVLRADPADLAIVTGDRMPSVELRGRRAPVDLSLSHHGRFVAYAFAQVDDR